MAFRQFNKREKKAKINQLLQTNDEHNVSIMSWIKVMDVIRTSIPIHSNGKVLFYYIYYYVNYSMRDVVVLNEIAQQPVYDQGKAQRVNVK